MLLLTFLIALLIVINPTLSTIETKETIRPSNTLTVSTFKDYEPSDCKNHLTLFTKKMPVIVACSVIDQMDFTRGIFSTDDSGNVFRLTHPPNCGLFPTKISRLSGCWTLFHDILVALAFTIITIISYVTITRYIILLKVMKDEKNRSVSYHVAGETSMIQTSSISVGIKWKTYFLAFLAALCFCRPVKSCVSPLEFPNTAHYTWTFKVQPFSSICMQNNKFTLEIGNDVRPLRESFQMWDYKLKFKDRHTSECTFATDCNSKGLLPFPTSYTSNSSSTETDYLPFCLPGENLGFFTNSGKTCFNVGLTFDQDRLYIKKPVASFHSVPVVHNMTSCTATIISGDGYFDPSSYYITTRKVGPLTVADICDQHLLDSGASDMTKTLVGLASFHHTIGAVNAWFTDDYQLKTKVQGIQDPIQTCKSLPALIEGYKLSFNYDSLFVSPPLQSIVKVTCKKQWIEFQIVG